MAENIDENFEEDFDDSMKKEIEELSQVDDGLTILEEIEFPGVSKSGEEEPKWADFPAESIRASIEVGEILPELRPRKNAIYRVTLKSLPKEVISSKGNFYVVEIDYEGLLMSLKANRSFNFCLKRHKVRNNLRYSDLVGRELVFQKNEKGFFVVQIK